MDLKNTRPPEPDKASTEAIGAVRWFIMVSSTAFAAFTLILLWADAACAQWQPLKPGDPIPPAAASAAPPSAPASAAGEDSEPGAPPPAAASQPRSTECTNCYLTERHDAYYRAYLKTLQERIAAAPPPADLSPLVSNTERAATAAEGARSEISGLRADLAADAGRDREAPAFTGWHFGAHLMGAGVTQNGESETPVVTRAAGYARWVSSKTNLGLEGAIGAGPWFSGGHTAVAVGGTLLGVAWWENLGIFAGADLSHLQNTTEGKPGDLLGLVVGGVDMHSDSVGLRLFAAPAVTSEEPATTGLFLGGALVIGN